MTNQKSNLWKKLIGVLSLCAVAVGYPVIHVKYSLFDALVQALSQL